MKKLFLSILFSSLFVIKPISAQNPRVEMELAEQFFSNAEYDKAIEIYEEIYKNRYSDHVYERLLESYVHIEDFKEAEKLVKSNIKNLSLRYDLKVDLGYLKKIQGNDKSAEKEYEDAIKNLPVNMQSVVMLANAFIEKEEYIFAEKTYLKGRELLQNDRLFYFELARVYSFMGETVKMLDEYLDVLATNPAYLQSIQNILQSLMSPDHDGVMSDNIRKNLLKRIQDNPQEEVYSELLIWLYIQNEDFFGAFVQAKALDRRKGENGSRLYSLAQISAANKEYGVAENSYRYIIEKGKTSPYYLSSRIELVKVLKDKITGNPEYTQLQLLELKKEYQNTIEDLGSNSYNYPLLMGLAELQAFYLHEQDSATMLLNNLLEYGNLKEKDKAEAKLLLADILLITGNIWEASLLYSQVEKAFKYDEPGERAKFKNAKISFYTGDFKWAQAQLDVLKGSTSKLISNDAMYLSLLITDNIGLDSNETPLKLYAKADLLLMQNKDSLAINTLDSITYHFPESSLRDDILFTKYKIAYKNRQYLQAANYLEELNQKYANDILGDDALYYLARLYENHLNDKEKAQEYYKKILFDYPASLYVVEARKRFRELRGDEPDRKENETIILN